MKLFRYIVISTFSLLGLISITHSIVYYIKYYEIESKIEGDSGLGGFAYWAGIRLTIVFGIIFLSIAFLTYMNHKNIKKKFNKLENE